MDSSIHTIWTSSILLSNPTGSAFPVGSHGDFAQPAWHSLKILSIFSTKATRLNWRRKGSPRNFSIPSAWLYCSPRPANLVNLHFLLPSYGVIVVIWRAITRPWRPVQAAFDRARMRGRCADAFSDSHCSQPDLAGENLIQSWLNMPLNKGKESLGIISANFVRFSAYMADH